MPSPNAHIQEAICACVAPTACAAWNTITAELAKPTSTVMKPATTAGNERSRNNERLATADMTHASLTTRSCIVGSPAQHAQRACCAFAVAQQHACMTHR
ncbi:hypothetical protein D9M73_263520 [compost metagenome]